MPDLAIEVVSPHERFEEVMGKVEEYFAAGVEQVGLVLPIEKKAYVYDSPSRVRIRAASDELDGGTLLPGFRLPLIDLFMARAGSTVAG